MLALTFATLFRNSLVGFGLAALYWALDLPPGAPLNPFLSLQSLTSYYSVLADPERRTIVEHWNTAKYILLAAAVLLYLYHSRLVFALGSSQTLRTRRRALALYSCLLLGYIVSGAAYKVYFGYQHRGHLASGEVKDPNDLTWFRYQFASFGPIPVASLFGPDFTRFLGDFTNPWRSAEDETDRMGDTPKHRQDLKDIAERNSGSRWAPSAAQAYVRLEIRRQRTLEAMIAMYQWLIDRFPNSPYVEWAIRGKALRYADAGRMAEAHANYDELLRRYPQSQFRTEAERALHAPDSSPPTGGGPLRRRPSPAPRSINSSRPSSQSPG
jgi:hypothetical protein